MRTCIFFIMLFVIGCSTQVHAQSPGNTPPKKLVFSKISKTAFDQYLLAQTKRTKQQNFIDSKGYIKTLDLNLTHYCKDICESFLVENKTSKKMTLPSNYDSGMLGMLFSPSEKQFIVFSSYDGPDYTDYYDYRSEIFAFNIIEGKGLEVIQLNWGYFEKDWSIEDLTWINEHTIALKIYRGSRWGDGSQLHFEYFKTSIK